MMARRRPRRHLRAAAVRSCVRITGGLLLVVGILGAVTASPAGATTAEREPAKRFGQLPVRFEANQGQTDPEVQFLACDTEYTVFLARTEAVLTLARPGSADVVRLSLADVNNSPELVGLDRLEGHSNYYTGHGDGLSEGTSPGSPGRTGASRPAGHPRHPARTAPDQGASWTSRW